MKQYLSILLSLFLTVTSFAQTKVDGSLLKGDVIGGTASDTRRIVVPKDTKANLDAKTRLEANLVYGTDTKKAYIDNGTDLIAVGSGSGGAVNLITDGDAENAISSIFVPYDDVGVAFPIDGTGGSPTVTTSITSTNPLTGAKSYLLTKPASVVQGQGWSIPFTVDPSYRAKVLKISLDYIVNSGTFTAGSATVYSDIIWYVYDVTNSKLIEPSSTRMFSNSSTISSTVEATFQTSATGSSYRLIAHMATGFSTAFELKIDNVTVSPSVYVYGTPITDWVSWTPTGSWTTNTTYTGKKRQVGDEFEYMVKVATSGAPNAATLTINLQETIDTTKLNSTVLYSSAFESSGIAYDSGNAYPVKVLYNSSTVVQVVTGANPTTLATNTVPFTFGAGDEINIRFTLPILGKSSSVQMSDSADTRVVQAKYRFTTSKTSGPTAPLNFDTIVSDSGNVTTGAAWKFTAHTSGKYVVQVAHNSSGASVTTQLFKNGSSVDNIFTSPFSAGNGQLNGSCEVDLVAGDYIDIRFDSSTSSNGGYVNIFKLSGPSAIAASESVNAVYTTAAGQSIPNATDTIIDFGTPEINTHGNVTTGAAWKFTAQINGVYEVSAYIQFLNGGAWNTAEDGLVSIFKNGSNFTRIGNTASTATHGAYVPIPCAARQIRLLAGDYIDLRAYQTSGSALGLAAASTLNWVSIKKVGN